MDHNFNMVAKTLFGFEEILALELRNLGASGVRTGVRVVFFQGDTGFMYKANLCLRTALKILKPIASFPVRDEKDLYKKILRLPWERYMSSKHSFVVDSLLKSDSFKHSLFVSQKVKDAIVDHFREKEGRRPDVDTRKPDIRIHIHIQQNRCEVSLDSSGNSLHHRGYRTATNIAPINEVLAAGVLLLSGWDGRSHFLDPMCGSGTLLIEAAMIACNIPANINRDHFSFENWPDFDQRLYAKIREAALNKTREFNFKIKGFDKAPSAVQKAIQNVGNANLSEYIQIERQNFFETEKFTDGPLHLVFNPPYGERLSIQLKEFYGNIGDTLKKGYPGTQAWLITANMEALKHVGLKTSRKIKLFNGKLESRLVKYEMYEGSKKAKYQKQNGP